MSDPFQLSLGGAPFGASPSFVDLLRAEHPDTVPVGGGGLAVPRAARDHDPGVEVRRRHRDGGRPAGDVGEPDRRREDPQGVRRRQPERDRIAGAAGQAVEMVKLFQLELEHYEKITGDRLSLEGKANRLAQMIRGNFPLAMQGLVVVPLFGGFDERREEGRIFYYDATGGRWEEDDYQTTGSGGQPAKNSLKKRWRPGLTRDEALRVAAEALIDAAEDDAATGGPDLARRIWPVMVVVTSAGSSDVPEAEVTAAVDAVVAERGGAA